MKILLVEDNKKLTEALHFLMEKEKIYSDIAHDGEIGLALGLKSIYDVIILDIMLPKLNGLEILQNLRKSGDLTPILLLTAKDAIEDRVRGLELGADDYLVKPFATEELIARIKSLARRAARECDGDRLTLSKVTFNCANQMLRINGREQMLSAKEGQLLEMLMRRPEQIFTREQILDKIWGYDADIMLNNVEIYVHHLRKKIGKDAGIELKTVRNLGYLLRVSKNDK
jgi:DNA-binding response OmpR family regulator